MRPSSFWWQHSLVCELPLTWASFQPPLRVCKLFLHILKPHHFVPVTAHMCRDVTMGVTKWEGLYLSILPHPSHPPLLVVGVAVTGLGSEWGRTLSIASLIGALHQQAGLGYPISWPICQSSEFWCQEKKNRQTSGSSWDVVVQEEASRVDPPMAKKPLLLSLN